MYHNLSRQEVNSCFRNNLHDDVLIACKHVVDEQVHIIVSLACGLTKQTQPKSDANGLNRLNCTTKDKLFI